MITAETTDKRTRIIETALDLFTNQGLQQTSMAQLSKESGVAVGTMYLNFKSKDDLIEGIFLYIQEAFGKFVNLSDDEMKLSFKNRFNLVGKRAYMYYVQNPSHFFFVDTHNYSPLISKQVREKGRGYYQQSIDILNEGIETGVFNEIHTVLLIRWVYNGIIALVQLKLNDDIDVNDATVVAGMERIWKSLT